MIEEVKKYWKDLSKSEKIIWFLAGISLWADMLAIIPTLVGKYYIQKNTFPNILSPGFAFGIWVLGVFTYAMSLHAHWEKHSRIDDNSFSSWFFHKLIINFEKPVFLFPVLILTIMLFFIANYADSSGSLIALLVLTLIICTIALLAFKSEFAKTKRGKIVNLHNFRSKIEDDWISWENRINLEFKRKFYLTPSDFNDIALVEGLERHAFEIILATYATKYPEVARFGNLYDRTKRDKVRYSFEAIIVYDALVNLKTLDHQRYYIN